jgi:hypothetical protein
VTRRTIVATAAGVLVAVVVAIVVSQLSNGSSARKIAGMPSNVAAVVGPDPLVVTLHGSVLEILSQPAVDQLSALETRVSGITGVRAAYGPVAWLRGQLVRLAAEVKARTTAKVSRADVLVRLSASGGLTIDDGELMTTLAFGTGERPLRSLRWLFPSADQARLYVRLGAGAARARVAAAISQLVNGSQLLGITATVSG